MQRILNLFWHSRATIVRLIDAGRGLSNETSMHEIRQVLDGEYRIFFYKL